MQGIGQTFYLVVVSDDLRLHHLLSHGDVLMDGTGNSHEVNILDLVQHVHDLEDRKLQDVFIHNNLMDLY